MDSIINKFIQLKDKENYFDEYYHNKLKSKHKKFEANYQKYIQNVLLFIHSHEIDELKESRLPLYLKRKSLQPSKRRDE